MVARKLRILLIEDDVWLADSLTASLKNFAVSCVNDPEEAFSLIEDEKPDLILADVVLGSKNLFVLLNEIQSYVDTRQIPIVILSAQAERIDIDDVAEFNIKLVLDKSEFTPESLNRDLQNVILRERKLSE